jgi:tRNA-2-methylthio-N6-dimethylallyladenosine synthase
MNKSDSERIAAVIEKMGYRWTDEEEQADLLGIIACSVRQKAIDKVYTNIHKWNSWKDRNNLVTFITGCILPADRSKFLKLFDLIFQISELPQLPEMLRTYGVVTPFSLRQLHDISHEITDSGIEFSDFETLVFDNRKRTIAGKPLLMKTPETRITHFWHVEPRYQSSFEAFIPIQNGCDKFCSFCAVPYTRGREISRPSEEILGELRKLVDKDYKSITLLGQNVNSYGLDKNGKEISFSSLLSEIGRFGKESGKDFWVYFTSPHPRDMSDDVLKVMSEYNCLAKQVHLPLQSGDDKVLIRMNRNHTISDYCKTVESIRKYLPSATLFTDIIVGFAGETDEQFENTRKAMELFRFNMAYIARYSLRPGTVSSHWDDDIPHTIKKERLHILSDLLQQHSLEHNRDMIGKTFKVLVTGRDQKNGYMSGHTEGRIIVRFPWENEKLIGNFADVEISSSAEFAVEGELIKVYNSELTEA